MSRPLDEVGTRAAAALDQAAQQRADGLSLEELRRRRRARHQRRGARGTVLVLLLVIMVATAMVVRPGPGPNTVLERPSATPTPTLLLDASEAPAADEAGTATSPDALPDDPDVAPAAESGWQPLPASPLRAAFGAAAAWTGEEFLVWGGYARGGTPAEGSVADAAAYDPAADRWRALPAAPIPGAHDGEALWTGEEVWVLGGFGGEAGREPMRGAAAYDPASDRWRVLPDLPAPMRAAAWLDNAAAVLTADGALLTLGADDGAWIDAPSSTLDPPFTATDGDGALLVVAADGLHTLTAANIPDVVYGEGNLDFLGLDPAVQDQRMGVATTVMDDGGQGVDTISTVVVGETETRVSTLGASQYWRIEGPPAARFLPLTPFTQPTSDGSSRSR